MLRASAHICAEAAETFPSLRCISGYVSETDAELIRRAREDPDALGDLYLRWKQPLFSWFRGRLPEPEASELTAELFAQVALSLRRFRDEAGGSAGPWLYGIARNLLRRYYERGRIEREARRRLGMPIRTYDAGFDEVEERIDMSNSGLDAALDSLPQQQREALELRVVEERSYREIASTLACSEVAARLRVMKALGKLTSLLRAPPA